GRIRKRSQLARIRTLEHGYPRIGAQPWMQLAVADVERDHPGGPALKQDIREPTCRRADVETIASARIDAKRVEGMCKLVPAAGDVRRGSRDLQGRSFVELLPRLGVPVAEAGHDERLGLRARLGETALDEQDVEPLLHEVRATRPATISASDAVSASIS